MNYKNAWSAYRRSYMRDFPNNGSHLFEVKLMLAKTYREMGDWSNAADLYLWLGQIYNSKIFLNSLRDFIELLKRNDKKDKSYYQALVELEINRSEENSRIPLSKESIEFIDHQDSLIHEYSEALKRDNFSGIIRRARDILKLHPGLESTKWVIRSVNNRMVEYFLNNPWNSMIEPLIDLYPVKTLSNLAYRLWKNKNC